VVLAPTDRTIEKPDYTGVCEALKEGNTDVRIFGKPKATPGRRMGVLLHWADSKDADVDKLKDEARRIADKISVVEGK
jgi:phosphoribosylglycinamide formyltransferase 2